MTLICLKGGGGEYHCSVSSYTVIGSIVNCPYLFNHIYAVPFTHDQRQQEAASRCGEFCIATQGRKYIFSIQCVPNKVTDVQRSISQKQYLVR